MWEIFTSALAVVYPLEFEWQQVFFSLQDPSRILANLNKAVFRIVSTPPLISKSSSSSTNPLLTVPSAPITVGITVTFMFHCFCFQSSNKFKVLMSLFAVSLFLWSAWTAKAPFRWILFYFLFTITRPGRLFEIRWFGCISNSKRIFCVSFSLKDSWLCI